MALKKVNGIGNNPYQGKFVKFNNKESLKWQILKKYSSADSQEVSSCNGKNDLSGYEWDGEIFVDVWPSTIPYDGGIVNVTYGGKMIFYYSNGYTKTDNITLIKDVPISGRTDSGEIKYMNIPLYGSFEGDLDSGIINWDGVTQLGARRPSFVIDMQDSYYDRDSIKLNTIRQNLAESAITWNAVATSTFEGDFSYHITDDYVLALENHFIGYVLLTADAEDCVAQSKVIYINCKEHIIDPSSYSYDIINITNPIIEWNETSAIVEYDEIIDFKYYDGEHGRLSYHKAIDSIDYFGHEFSANTTSSPIYYDGFTENWSGVTKTWRITQCRNEHGVRSVHYQIDIIDNGREVEWNDTSELINYNVTTTIEYYNGDISTSVQSKVTEMTYDINSGYTPITREKEIRYPESGENYAHEIAYIIQKSGAKDVKSIKYEIIEVDDKKWVEWNITSSIVPFKVSIVKTLNDGTMLDPEIISSTWTYNFEKNQNDYKLDRYSTIKYPKDETVNYDQKSCVTYQYGGWQVISGSETYDLEVSNRPTVEWDTLSADINLNLVTRLKYHNGKTGETKSAATEKVSGWTVNSGETTIERSGMTQTTQWHDLHAQWYVDQLAGKVLLNTIYEIVDVYDSVSDPSLYVEYSETYHQVPFTGRTSCYYKDSSQNTVTDSELLWDMKFEKNYGSTVEQRTDNIIWKTETKECMIKQHGAKEDSGNRAYKIPSITPYDNEDKEPKYGWDLSGVQVTYTGETYVIYRDGTTATTALTADTLYETGDITPDNTSAHAERRTGQVTWPKDATNPAHATWQCYKQGGKTIADISYSITKIRPLIGTEDPEPYLNYNADTVVVTYTGNTHYTYVDTTTEDISTYLSENAHITPHTGVTATTYDIRQGEVTWPSEEKKVIENNKWSEYIHGEKEFVTGATASFRAYTDNVQQIVAKYNDTTAYLEFDFHLERLCYDGTFREDTTESRQITQVDKVSTEDFGLNDTDKTRDISGKIVYSASSKTGKVEEYTADVNWYGIQENNPFKTVTFVECSAQQTGETPTVQWNIVEYKGLTCKATLVYHYEQGLPTTSTTDFTIDVSWATTNTGETTTAITNTKQYAIDLSSLKNPDGSFVYPNIETYAKDHGGHKPNVDWKINQHGKWEKVTSSGESHFCLIYSDAINAEWNEATKPLSIVYEYWNLCYVGSGETPTTANSKVTTVEYVKGCTKYDESQYRESATKTEILPINQPIASFSINNSDESRPINGTYDYGELTNNSWKGTQGYNPALKIVGVSFSASQSNWVENISPKIEYNIVTTTIPCTAQGQYAYESGNLSAVFDLNGNYTITVNDDDGLQENKTTSSVTYSKSRNNAFNVKDDTALSDKCRKLESIDWYPDVNWTLYQWGAKEFLPDGEGEITYEISGLTPLNEEYSASSDNLIFNYVVKKECHDHTMREDTSLREEGVTHQVSFGVNESDLDREIGWDKEGCDGKFNYKKVSGITWSGKQGYNKTKRVTKIEGAGVQLNVEVEKNPLINWNVTTVSIENEAQITYTFEVGGKQSPISFSSETFDIQNIENNKTNRMKTISGTKYDWWDMSTHSLKGWNYCKDITPTDKKIDIPYVYYQHGQWEIDPSSGYVYEVTSVMADNSKTVAYNVKEITITFTRLKYSYTYGNCLVYDSKEENLTAKVHVDEINEGYTQKTYPKANYQDVSSSTLTFEYVQCEDGNVKSNYKLNNLVPWQITQNPNPDTLINTISYTVAQSADVTVKIRDKNASIPYTRTFILTTSSSIPKTVVITKDKVTVNGVESDAWDDVKSQLTFDDTQTVDQTWTSSDTTKTGTESSIKYTFPKVRNLTSTRELSTDLKWRVNVSSFDVAFYYNGNIIDAMSYDGTSFTGDTTSPTTYTSISLSPNVTSISTGITNGKSTLKSVNGCLGLTNICNSAFASCTVLSSVTITDKVTSIGKNAFEGCKSLVSLNETNTLSSGMTSVAQSTFKNCTSLSAITIPSTITTINQEAFFNDSNLCNITLNNNLKTIGVSAFSNCFSTDTVKSSAKTKGVVIPNSVTNVGAHAFDGCQYIPSVTLSTGMTKIEDYTFANCYGGTLTEYYSSWVSFTKATNCLEDINFPQNITSIGNYAFYKCYALSGITFNDKLETIGAYSFAYCCEQTCTGITIPDSVTSIGNNGTSDSGHTFYKCYKLQTVKMTNNSAFKEISLSTFEYCTGMTSCDLRATEGSKLEIINDYAFRYCTSLNNIILPDSTIQLHTQAFYSASSLSDINITKNINYIGEGGTCGTYSEVFSYCHSLATVTVDSNNSTFYNEDNGNCCLYKQTYGVHPKGCICFGGNNPTLPSSTTIYGEGSLHVGQYAFEGNIQSGGKSKIEIPETFLLVDMYAFYECTGIYQLDINNSQVTTIDMYAYAYCSSLGAMIAPSTLNTIGDYAFYNCTNLTRMELNEGLDTIGSYAFYNDKIQDNSSDGDKEGIVIPSTVSSIGSSAFESNTNALHINIPTTASSTSIGSKAFYSCYSAQDVFIGESVNDIGNEAFSYTYSVTSITVDTSNTTYTDNSNNICIIKSSNEVEFGCGNSVIPDSVTSIGNYAFEGNIKANNATLTSITFSDNVTKIQNYAFSGCSKLQNVTMDNTITTVGNGAFGTCTSLSSITLSNSLTSISQQMCTGCTKITSIVIPNSVTTINSEAFDSCTSLSSVTIGSGVTSINSLAFLGCNNLTNLIYADGCTKTIGISRVSYLTSVTIPDSVTTISSSAFRNASLLISVIIPKNVKEIDSYAFYGCLKLATINYNNYPLEWYEIERGTDWHYNVPVTVVICVDGTEVDLDQTS